MRGRRRIPQHPPGPNCEAPTSSQTQAGHPGCVPLASRDPSPSSPRFLPLEAPRLTQPCPDPPLRAVPCRALLTCFLGLPPSRAQPSRAAPTAPSGGGGGPGDGGACPRPEGRCGACSAPPPHRAGPTAPSSCVLLCVLFFFWQLSGVCLALRGCCGCSFPQQVPPASVFLGSSPC